MSEFNPPIFRYTVRTPESRREALKKHARRIGMTDGQLVQALFDCLDLTTSDAVKIAREHFERLFPRHETTRELADRAAAVGLTVRDLKVFRALAAAAGDIAVVTPSPMDITTRSGVDAAHLSEAYDRLTERGFISPRTFNRGRRSFAICRMPDL